MCELKQMKNTLRAECKSKRLAMTAQQREKADSAIFAYVRELLEGYEDERLYCYVSSPAIEVETRQLIDYALHRGMTVIVPKCVKEDVRLEQYAITSGDDLEKGFFGIEEPITGKCRQIKAPHEGICIVPGLAFDENGIRMGYGKGYYDRFLASFRGIRIGLCYECCIYSGTLPHDEYDAQMDLVISEKMVRKMKRGV